MNKALTWKSYFKQNIILLIMLVATRFVRDLLGGTSFSISELIMNFPYLVITTILLTATINVLIGFANQFIKGDMQEKLFIIISFVIAIVFVLI